jgi:hypothetical protein
VTSVLSASRQAGRRSLALRAASRLLRNRSPALGSSPMSNILSRIGIRQAALRKGCPTGGHLWSTLADAESASIHRAQESVLSSFGWLGWNEPPKRKREPVRRAGESRPTTGACSVGFDGTNHPNAVSIDVTSGLSRVTKHPPRAYARVGSLRLLRFGELALAPTRTFVEGTTLSPSSWSSRAVARAAAAWDAAVAQRWLPSKSSRSRHAGVHGGPDAATAGRRGTDRSEGNPIDVTSD